MFNIKLITNAGSREIVTSLSDTPMQFLANNGVSTQGANVSFRSEVLPTSLLDRTFADLGAHEDDTVMMSVIVKADSAA